jgi:hypothetical protein
MTSIWEDEWPPALPPEYPHQQIEERNRIPANLIEAAERFTERVLCPNCEGAGGWGGAHAPAVLDCPRCEGRGWVKKKTNAERMIDAAMSTPPTVAVLLGTLIAHADFQGIHRVWNWDERRKSYEAFTVTLWPHRRWHYHTQPKPSLLEAILEALQYLENPVEPHGRIP